LLLPLRIVTGFNGDVSSGEAARLSVDAIRACCTENSLKIQFEQLTYRQAMSKASNEDKLLFVYLHSGSHPDSAPFVKAMFCNSDAVANVLQERMVCWGGSVEYLDAHRLSGLLSTSAYPCVAVLQPPSDSRSGSAKLLTRVEGKSTSEAIYSSLVGASESHANIVAQRMMQRVEATERQNIRDEQDRELQEAMEIDRRRQQVRDQEELLQKEQENQLEKEKEMVLNRMATLENALGKEPQDISDGKGTMIRFQLPDGTKFTRKFSSNDSLTSIRDFMEYELHKRNTGIVNFALAMNFPKKIFGPDGDCTISVKDAGLIPQAVLFVQDLDC